MKTGPKCTKEPYHNLNSILLLSRRIHLVVDTPKEIRKIQNVIGIIEGETEPGKSLYHFTKQFRKTKTIFIL